MVAASGPKRKGPSLSQKIVRLRGGPRGGPAPKRPRRSRASAAELLQSLRQRIAAQKILPGSKLREQDLADEFGVPRTRIREAFGLLEQRGLIERIPNRGAVVTRLDLEHVFHLYDVREVLEGLCARLATENAPPESWQDLVEHFDGPMGRFVRDGDFDSFIRGYERLRERTIEAARNPVAAAMLDSIYERTTVVIRRIIILPGRAETGLAQHRAVLAAMRRGDGAEAERLRRLNMRSAKEALQRFRQYVL
ncbi:MAG: GntR family transcriptional regulator [Alphaproteobacteria bacterium]|nr:GntR family transcriptional regulator [Alphaproteobacteria bacterium]